MLRGFYVFGYYGEFFARCFIVLENSLLEYSFIAVYILLLLIFKNEIIYFDF